jgi:P-type Cu+ transporter
MVIAVERGVPLDARAESALTILVTGVTCASCVWRVERALSKQEGVANASANFAAEKATVGTTRRLPVLKT